MALPEDLLWHLIRFLPWRDMIAYGSTCHMLMKWVFVGPFDQLNDAIKKENATMLYQYEELFEANGCKRFDDGTYGFTEPIV